MADTSGENIGLFSATYEIGNDAPGANLFEVLLAVSTPTGNVTGLGQITNGSIHGFETITSYLQGHYETLVFGGDVQYSVALTGHPSPPPLLSMPNVHLHMLMNGWEKGTASYRYSTDNGKTWKSVENAPVEAVLLSQLQLA
jgi:hypothetical protein